MKIENRVLIKAYVPMLSKNFEAIQTNQKGTFFG
jgi:hypothetical protein